MKTNQNNFSEILEQYPRSSLNKYGDWFEFLLRCEDGPGCYKIAGSSEQVKRMIDSILKRSKKE